MIRLEKLHLFLLDQKRLRRELPEVYKIMKDLDQKIKLAIGLSFKG